jgi:hypothetical protein
VLRRIFGWKRDEIILVDHNYELLTLYSSPNVIIMIKSRSMKWAGHVARMERRGINVGY